jgi:hypothetical protein
MANAINAPDCSPGTRCRTGANYRRGIYQGGSVNLTGAERVGTSRLTRHFIFPVLLILVAFLSFIDISVALLVGGSLGIPILLMGYAKDVDEYIEKHQTRGQIIDMGDVPKSPTPLKAVAGKIKIRYMTQEEKEQEEREFDRPKTWLRYSTMMFFISGIPIFGQIVVDSYGLSGFVPQLPSVPLLLTTGLIVLIVAFGYLIRFAFFMVNPAGEFAGSVWRYSVALLTVMIEVSVLSESVLFVEQGTLHFAISIWFTFVFVGVIGAVLLTLSLRNERRRPRDLGYLLLLFLPVLIAALNPLI